MMDNKFRLKREVRHLFGERLSTKSLTKIEWNKDHTVPVQLLDKVERVYVDYGIQTNPSTTTLKGHNGPSNEAHVDFTIRIQNLDHKDYKSIDVPEVMDVIQKGLNKYFKP